MLKDLINLRTGILVLVSGFISVYEYLHNVFDYFTIQVEILSISFLIIIFIVHEISHLKDINLLEKISALEYKLRVMDLKDSVSSLMFDFKNSKDSHITEQHTIDLIYRLKKEMIVLGLNGQFDKNISDLIGYIKDVK